METEFSEGKMTEQVRDFARAFPYPPTPDVAGEVMLRLRGGRPRRVVLKPAWAWGITLIVLLFLGLLAVPSVRAAVVEFLQIGALRIFLEEVTPPVPPDEPSSTKPLPEEAEIPTGPGLLTPTPSRPEILNSILELAGEVSLDEAREQFPYPILLPTYPPELGAPDKVFSQRLEGGRGIFLVWLDPEQPERVALSLLLLGPGTFAGKGAPVVVVETEVNGARAVWTEGEHLLVLQTGPNQRELVQLFVKGHVLVWEIDGITYRLESVYSMEEMVRIAESIR